MDSKDSTALICKPIPAKIHGMEFCKLCNYATHQPLKPHAQVMTMSEIQQSMAKVMPRTTRMTMRDD